MDNPDFTLAAEWMDLASRFFFAAKLGQYYRFAHRLAVSSAETPPRRGSGAPVSTYTLYVRDGRYVVPTLLTIESRDDEAARAHARRHLESSAHYQAVEIWEDERQVDQLSLDRA